MTKCSFCLSTLQGSDPRSPGFMSLASFCLWTSWLRCGDLFRAEVYYAGSVICNRIVLHVKLRKVDGNSLTAKQEVLEYKIQV